MNKIAIIGPPGAGKTTLARQLGEILNIEVIHLDRFFWHEGWEKAKPHTWEKKHLDLVQKDSWIIDGTYHESLETRLEAADTVIFLDMPRPLCTMRVITRHFNPTPRPDLRKECTDRLDWDFIKKVWNFPKRERPVILQTIQRQNVAKEVQHFRSKRGVSNFLQEVREKRQIPEQHQQKKIQRRPKLRSFQLSNLTHSRWKTAGLVFVLGTMLSLMSYLSFASLH